MLVLSRKTKQQITIGEDITITILRVRGQTVSLGVEAPDDVRILRRELPAASVGLTPPSLPDRLGRSPRRWQAGAGSDGERRAARRYVPAEFCGLP